MGVMRVGKNREGLPLARLLRRVGCRLHSLRTGILLTLLPICLVITSSDDQST